MPRSQRGYSPNVKTICLTPILLCGGAEALRTADEPRVLVRRSPEGEGGRNELVGSHCLLEEPMSNS